MEKIIAISAHPDDSEYYAGGVLSKIGGAVLVVVTDGGKNGSVAKRRREQDTAGRLVKYQKIIYLNYPDGKVDVFLKKIKKDLLKIFLQHKPGIIFSFDPHNQHVVHEDFHPDHRYLAHLVMDIALIDTGLIGLPRPKIWLYDAFAPNKKIKISLAKKLEILKQFESQNLNMPTSGYEEFRVY
jgi:LmbE family N-acetylglucosaminyl deacetylase